MSAYRLTVLINGVVRLLVAAVILSLVFDGSFAGVELTFWGSVLMLIALEVVVGVAANVAGQVYTAASIAEAERYGESN